MIFESLASKRPQEAALFLRPYLVSVLGLPVAKPHLWSSLVCKDYIIPHIVTLFLHTDSYIYIFPNRRPESSSYRVYLVPSENCFGSILSADFS